VTFPGTLVQGVVVVASDQSLLAETIGTALSARGFETWVVSLEPDDRCAVPLPGSATPVAGLLISGLDTYATIAAARAMVARLDVPWGVVTAARPGPAWGALIEAGAIRVLPSSVTVAAITALLELLVLGTQVREPDLGGDLLCQWLEFERERSAVAERLAALTPRERTILASLQGGGTVRDIATTRGVSEDAMGRQLRAVLVKLDLGAPLTAMGRLAELLLEPERGTTD
jgi:DNA-binding NarL/FixJ family response regulator